MTHRFLESFVSWAHACLLESDEADSYLLGRGVAEHQRVRHRLGYVAGDYAISPSLDPGHGEACSDRDRKSAWCDSCRFISWTTKWESPPGEDGGPKVPRVGRKIAGHIVFPLTSYSGSLVGVQVRSIVEKSYDSFFLKRRPEGYFFGTAAAIDSIWARRHAFLVEGPFDHLILERLVSPCTLAVTTSMPGGMQTRFINRFLDRVYLCFDEDKAGRTGTGKFLRSSDLSIDVVDVRYPRVKREGSDLHDFWKKVGDAEFSDYFRRHYVERF